MKGEESIPDGLAGYNLDKYLSHKYRQGSLFGCLAVLLLWGAAAYFLMAKAEAISAIVLGILGAIALAAFIYRQQFKKQSTQCRSCRQPLEPHDAPVPEEEIQPLQDGLGQDIHSHYQVSFLTPKKVCIMMSRDSDSGEVVLY